VDAVTYIAKSSILSDSLFLSPTISHLAYQAQRLRKIKEQTTSAAGGGEVNFLNSL
jgi:hypothetical protein